MGIKIKEFNNRKFEVLEHSEKPGFKKAFHIVLGVAVAYFIYIFSHMH
tara:strand:- start:544 stop:687 length:144 start_codon:yes stop_codon:yes gene_type:complete